MNTQLSVFTFIAQSGPTPSYLALRAELRDLIIAELRKPSLKLESLIRGFNIDTIIIDDIKE
jgi:hypothetical protein